MCGIVGKIGAFSQSEGLACVQKMNASILHRGPDDEGVWAKDGMAFGMRRLSIIDLEGGHQPLWTEDGVGIVFNGELYNYREKRAFLESQGYRFKTKSDTEVVLNLFHLEGESFTRHLEGMFGLALIDLRNQTLFLVRDRLGIKPLYYGFEKGELLWGSEIKAILAGMKKKPALNFNSIHHFLTLRYVPSPETIWENIYKLPPATLLKYDFKTCQHSLAPYWRLNFQSEPLDSRRDYVKEFESHFLGAVQSHLVASDVPVGILLSGGLDSSAVAAAAVELGHKNFHTFNVAFSDSAEFDESRYASEMANAIKSQHHEIRIGQKEYLDFLPTYSRVSDEPLADLASIPLHYVSKLARQNVKVVLSGEGSDEILAGYDFEKKEEEWNRLAKLNNLPKFALKTLGLIKPTLSHLGNEGLSQLLKNTSFHMTHVLSETEKAIHWKKHHAFASSERLIQSYYSDCRSEELLDQAQEVYCRSWLVEDLLMKADKMTMLNSLELRVPFLDHKFVEWAFTLPKAWKVGSAETGYVSKRILREFAKKRLPSSIIDRPKKGFPVPAYEWLNDQNPKPIGGWASDLLTSPLSRSLEFFEKKTIESKLAEARKGDLKAAHIIWNFLILELWLKEWT